MMQSLAVSTLLQQYESGEANPAGVLAEVLRRIDAYPDPAVWIERCSKEEIFAQLDAALARKKSGIAQPLLGIPFAIKDNIDLANHPTTAACPAFAYLPTRSATVVQRLCDAGAIAMGKTNLDQFATGLVGTRSPYGACRNVFDPRYISGGSSSGSAVAVAAGLVSFALGTDTAGSGRVPAAFNNIVGLKATRGVISTRGVVPACQSLDCVSIFALSCDDAAAVLRVAESYDPEDAYSRRRSSIAPHSPWGATFRFGIPSASDLQFFGDADAATLFQQSVERMHSLGGEPVDIDLKPFLDAALLLYNGPWLAERAIVAADLLNNNPEALLPTTRAILNRGKEFSATDTFNSLHRLEHYRQLAAAQWERMDVLLLPTAGTIYTADQLDADPIQLNSNLGRYTNFVNLLDLCAVAVPAGMTSNGLPFGITVIAPSGADIPSLELAGEMHRASPSGSGLARSPLPPRIGRPTIQPNRVRVAVVGAHLSGLPLNGQLTHLGATLVCATATAAKYRFYALPGTVPPKPGMVRVAEDGVSIELEVWEMSAEAFGQFVAAIPTPLGIGSIELVDGTFVHGFLCESFAVASARDISSFGGWRAYLKSL